MAQLNCSHTIFAVSHIHVFLLLVVISAHKIRLTCNGWNKIWEPPLIKWSLTISPAFLFASQIIFQRFLDVANDRLVVFVLVRI
jgi:hypothetical protein